MVAIPQGLKPEDGERLTGIICPDCAGVLTVHVEGKEYVLFTCRIGHVYALDELIELKEQRLEAALWSSVTSTRELEAILSDSNVHVERRERLVRQAKKLIEIIEANEPVNLGKTRLAE